jgi:hypothetical protein
MTLDSFIALIACILFVPLCIECCDVPCEDTGKLKDNYVNVVFLTSLSVIIFMSRLVFLILHHFIVTFQFEYHLDYYAINHLDLFKIL